jgi:hypothetical protein
MKLYTQYINPENVSNKLKGYDHVDFSLFHQCLPDSPEQLSQINILAIIEPSEYFDTTPWIIDNHQMFNAIMTWDDKILNICNNSIFSPFGNTSFTQEQYEKKYPKDFKISHLCGNLLKSYNHSMRHEILSRENEFKIETKFFKTIGKSKNNTYIDEIDRGNGKLDVFSDSMYGIAIENFSHRGYFSEKIIDLFLLRTIPIYCGCSNIGDFFNIKGIIEFKCVDDLIYTSNQLTEEYYYRHLDIIEENYQKALQYASYEQNFINKIKEIFTLNNIYESI